VTLRFFFGMAGQTPLAWLVLLVFTAGVLVGMLVLAGGLFRARRKIKQLTRQSAENDSLAVPAPAETLPHVES
ncbi:MAG: LapA family protein, partial [Zoogloeaceae bacterium]|nr:LapA family protein [Zoogloeaceae bacterium]